MATDMHNALDIQSELRTGFLGREEYLFVLQPNRKTVTARPGSYLYFDPRGEFVSIIDNTGIRGAGTVFMVSSIGTLEKA